MAVLTSVGYRLYKRDPQEVVTKAIAEIPAKVEFQMQTRSGYYPQRDITSANIGPGIPNGAAGIPLLGPGSFTLVGLKFELLVQTPPAGALVMSAGAGFSLFGNTGGGTPLLGSVDNGAGTSLFGGPGAGISVFVGQYGGVPAPAPPPATPSAATVFVPVTATFSVPVNIAAVVGRPAVTRSVGSHGWDAGALSAKSFMGDGYVSFRVQPRSKALAGLQVGSDPLDFAAPAYQFFFDPAVYYAGAYARGVAAFHSATPPGSIAGGGGSFVPSYEGSLFTVRKRGLVVEFINYYDPQNVGVFTTTVPEALRYEVFSLGAILYTPGTYVEGVEVYQYVISEGVLPALAGSAGAGPVLSGGAGRLPALTGRAGLYSGSAGVLPALIGAGGRISASSAGVLPKLFGWASTEAAVLTPRSAGVLPALTGRGFSLVGTVGSSSVTLPSLAGSGGRPLAIGLGAIPSMAGYGSGLENEYVTMFTHLLNISPITAGFQLAVVMDSFGVITTAIGVARIRDASLNTAAVVSDAAVLSAALAAYMNTQILAGSVTPVYELGGSVWAVNLSENFATSTFENYDFNSFGVIGGRAFGAKADGLFLLEGDTDDGLPIQASVSYGKQDFGTKTDKRMISAYVGASSTGKMYLKIIAQGKEHLYVARSSSGHIQQQRFDIGRGLAGTYFTFELFNRNGGDFEIDSVTFVAADFKRRI